MFENRRDGNRTSEVVPNGLQVVPNGPEVVPNDIEVVPINSEFFHPLKKTNDMTVACHDVTTSSRHLSPVDFPGVSVSPFAQRGALSRQVLLFDHGSVSNQSGPHIVSGFTRRVYFL